MSAEVETSKDEETKEQPRKNFRQKFQKYWHWQIGIKILELLLCALCIGFAYDSVKTVGLGSSNLHHVGIMYTAYTGYILINVVFLTSYSLGDTIPYRTSALFSISAAALFLITGVLLLVDRSTQIARYSYDSSMSELTMIVISVVFAFINSAVFTVEAVLTFRRQEDF